MKPEPGCEFIPLIVDSNMPGVRLALELEWMIAERSPYGLDPIRDLHTGQQP